MSGEKNIRFGNMIVLVVFLAIPSNMCNQIFNQITSGRVRVLLPGIRGIRVFQMIPHVVFT
jgi:hypothetical protein